MSLSPTLAFQFNFCVHLGWVHFVADFSKRFSISSLFFRQFQFPFVSRFRGKCDRSRNLLVIPLFTLFRQLSTVHCFLLTDNCLLFSDNSVLFTVSVFWQLFTVFCLLPQVCFVFTVGISSISRHCAPLLSLCARQLFSLSLSHFSRFCHQGITFLIFSFNACPSHCVAFALRVV